MISYLKDSFAEKKGLFCLSKFLTNTTFNETREICLKAFNNASLFDELYKLKITDEGVMDTLIELLNSQYENN